MLNELVPLVPAHFFQIQVDAYYGKRILAKHTLPDLSTFSGQKSFASVSLAWHEEGIAVHLEIKGKFETAIFPNIQIGDSIELFFDTRDVKTSAFNTKFCHHFFFLPFPVEHNENTIQAGEITRFRAEDKHSLCSAEKLQIKKNKKGYFEIFIPAECLYGYDSSQFHRLGFTYRVNKHNHQPQYFSAYDEDFSIEREPALWASLNMVR